MEHVEEAGVHSGDTSCSLPAPSARRHRVLSSLVRLLGPGWASSGS